MSLLLLSLPVTLKSIKLDLKSDLMIRQDIKMGISRDLVIIILA